MRGQAIGTLFKDAVDEWLHDNVQRLGAALAYYTIFSLAPLLIIAIAISSILFGQEAAQGHIFNQIQSLIGEDGARAIQTMVENARNRPHSGRLATVIGIIMLIVGATGLFAQLQESLNTIWGVVTKPGRGLLGVIRDRFLSFMLVLGSGFLLLVSLLLSAGLAAMGKFFQHLLPVPGRRPRNRQLFSRQIPDRNLPGPDRHRLGLRSGRLARHHFELGLLLGADFSVRSRADLCLCQSLRHTNRAVGKRHVREQAGLGIIAPAKRVSWDAGLKIATRLV